jgi:hypothetical protein
LADLEQAALNAKKQTPLQIAEAGGRHSGFLHQRLGKTPDELLREAKSLRQRATRASGQNYEPDRLQQNQRWSGHPGSS